MKTTVSIICLLGVLFFISCSKDDPAPDPQENLTPGPELENQAPGSFTASAEVDKNKVQLNWTAAEDPDGDAITYKIMIGDSLIGSQTNTSLDLTGLLFEKDYEGTITADDGKGHLVETSFNFTTGILWLASYTGNSGTENYTSYEYDENDFLITAVRQPDNEHRNIVYDAKGQIFSIGDITYEHNANGLLTNTSDGTGRGDLEFLYDDQDRISALRVTRMSPSNNYVGVVEMTYNYNAIGNLTLLDFERSHTSDNTNGSPVQSFQRWKLSHDNDGNLASFIFERSDDGITYTETFKEVFIYDDRKNPFSMLISRQFKFNSPILYGLQHDFDPHGIVGYNLEGYSLKYYRGSHNVTNYKLYVDGELNTEYTYEYTYNDSGYPIAAKWSTGNHEFFPKWTYHD